MAGALSAICGLPATHSQYTPSAHGYSLGAVLEIPRDAVWVDGYTYDPYALSGGRHAGSLKNYSSRSTPEIERGITSIEKQIAEHRAKIENPVAHIEDWATLDPRQQQALLPSKWPNDIARQQKQLDNLRGILGSR